MAKMLKSKYLKIFSLTLGLFLLPNLFVKPADVASNSPNVKISLNPTPSVDTSQTNKENIQETQNVKNNNSSEKSDPNKEDIYLNFENATLASVVNYLAEQKNINIIPRKELETINVTLSTQKPMNLDRAWNVLLTLLEMNNYTIIDVDNLYRIVPKVESKQEPLPFYSSGTGTEPEDLPNSDLVVRYIYFLKNIKTETVQNILSQMLEGDVQVNKDLEACIITEKCLNIKAAMKIVTELDTGGLRESIKIIALNYANASDVENLFKNIIPQSDQQHGSVRFIGPSPKKPSTFFSTDTKIIADIRKNSLILLGTETNLNKIIDFISKYIDIPITAAESRLHIKEIKYAKAEKLKPIIDYIIKPPMGAGTDKTKVMGEFKFFEDVIIAADTSGEGGGNRLIIACNKDDWKRLDTFIDKLDKPQPQIAFEIMVVDVNIENDKSFGTQFKKKTEGDLGGGVTARVMNLATENIDKTTNKTDLSTLLPGLAATSGSAFLTAGVGSSMWLIVRSVLNTDNFSIISQPFLVANNNENCSISFGETRSVLGKMSADTSNNRSVIYEDIPANTLVELTPKMNLDGTLSLEKLTITINEFLSKSSTSGVPDRLNRVLDTKVSLATGEVLVLGGLTRSTLTEKHYKTPILSSIPIIGNLFRSETSNKIKTNLYVFIRPSIIKPRFEGVPDEYTQLKLDYAKLQTLNVDSYPKERDPIQRWFFRPTKQTTKQKIEDAQQGIFRPIDNYSYGYNQPKSVDIRLDPYFRVSEAVEKEKAKNPVENNTYNVAPNTSQRKALKRRHTSISSDENTQNENV